MIPPKALRVALSKAHSFDTSENRTTGEVGGASSFHYYAGEPGDLSQPVAAAARGQDPAVEWQGRDLQRGRQGRLRDHFAARRRAGVAGGAVPIHDPGAGSGTATGWVGDGDCRSRGAGAR